MKLFDKLFGHKAEQVNTVKVRAQYKNEKYFRKEIVRIEDWIKKDIENNKEYREKYGDITPYHYESTRSLYNQMAECMYSMGEQIEKIRPVLMKSIDYFEKSWDENFQGMALLVNIASKSVLFEIPEEHFQKVTNFIDKAYNSKIKDMWKPDSLVFFLIGGSIQRKSQVPAFEKLYNITQLPNDKAEKKIKAYLDNWYQMHKDAPWYDSHTRSYGYSGYWAWEVAAVVKSMNLNDDSFKDNPYYPYGIIHWNEKKDAPDDYKETPSE